jgi:GNAT superfamily N-acetyltransferase
MSVIIKEVVTKKELLKWVRFPNELYKDNEYFVPFLENDEMETFTREKNPSYEFCETKLFLAFKEGRIVGRIAGLINHAYNKKWKQNAIRYTRFDFIDDFEVSEKLLSAVVDWGKERGFSEIMGPIGFNDMDHQGMLIEGFDKLNMSITFYNHPYYIEHMERLGLAKAADWIEYKIKCPGEVDPRIERLAKHALERGEYTIVTYSERKALNNDAFEALKVIDEAEAILFGTVPLTPEVIKYLIDNYISLVNLDYVCAVKDAEGRIVAFGAMVPSLAKAFKQSNGKLFPFGVVHMFKALRSDNDTLEMFLVAVDPEYQMFGVPAILMDTLLRKCIENKVQYCETGPMLETNKAVHGMWRYFEKEQHKRRRCYSKVI